MLPPLPPTNNCQVCHNRCTHPTPNPPTPHHTTPTSELGVEKLVAGEPEVGGCLYDRLRGGVQGHVHVPTAASSELLARHQTRAVLTVPEIQAEEKGGKEIKKKKKKKTL